MSALQGLRVIDLGTFIAGPFCATLLGEFGAEVIKVEPPQGDSARRFGTDTECGDTLVWLSESRNKKCVSLDLRTPEGIALLHRLVEKADVVVENFRTGVIEKWGLDWDKLKKINPRCVLVRISGYGQDGPYSERPGFARVAHAFSGLAYLAGEPGRIPVVPGSTSLADYMSGLYGAFGALVALKAREKTGEGQCVDLALYEPVFRVLDEIVPAFERHGFVRERMGADTVNVCPHSHYKTRDGEWVAIACSNDDIFRRLAEVIGNPGLAAPDRWGNKDLRFAAREAVNAVVDSWTGSLDCDEVLAQCNGAGVPASRLYSIADIFADPHYQARKNITVHDSRIGPLAVPGVVPKLMSTPGEIRWLGAALGEHTEEVLRDLLAVSSEEMARLRYARVI